MIKGTYVLLVFLEWLTLIYMISIWLLPDSQLRRTVIEYVSPFFVPFRKLQKISILNCKIDFSYFIFLLVIYYCKQVVLAVYQSLL